MTTLAEAIQKIAQKNKKTLASIDENRINEYKIIALQATSNIVGDKGVGMTQGLSGNWEVNSISKYSSSPLDVECENNKNTADE